MWVVVSESVQASSTQLYFFSWDINVHQHHLVLCDVSYIIALRRIDLILHPFPQQRAKKKMYFKSSKVDSEFDTTGKTRCHTVISSKIPKYWSLIQKQTAVSVYVRLLKMQNNLWLSLSPCLINSETCLFLAGSHTEKEVGASFIIPVFSVFSPLGNVKDLTFCRQNGVAPFNLAPFSAAFYNSDFCRGPHFLFRVMVLE